MTTRKSPQKVVFTGGGGVDYNIYRCGLFAVFWGAFLRVKNKF